MWLTLKNSILTSQRTNWDYITNTYKINSFYNTCLSSKWSTHPFIHPPIHPSIHPWRYIPFWALIFLRRHLHSSLLSARFPILVFLASLMCPSERLPLILFFLENNSESTVNTTCAQNPEFSVLNQVVHTLTTFLSSIQCIWRASLENAVVCMHMYHVRASWKAQSLSCCIALLCSFAKLRQIWCKICKHWGRSFRSRGCQTSRLPYVSNILDQQLWSNRLLPHGYCTYYYWLISLVLLFVALKLFEITATPNPILSHLCPLDSTKKIIFSWLPFFKICEVYNIRCDICVRSMWIV